MHGPVEGFVVSYATIMSYVQYIPICTGPRINGYTTPFFLARECVHDLSIFLSFHGLLSSGVDQHQENIHND